MATVGVVVATIVVLLVSNGLKAWSTLTLWRKYQRQEYWSDETARRLFLIGKITPVISCAAIVALAYTTRLWWVELPAWLLLAVIVYGVVKRIREARRS